MPGSAFRPPSPPTLTSAGCRDRPAIYSGLAASHDRPRRVLPGTRLAWRLLRRLGYV